MASVFLVEDEDGIRELVYYALKSEGYSVVAFEDSQTFWKQIQLEKPAIILLDIMLPKENGLDILRSLKRSKDTELIPVIMLTAVRDEQNRIEGLDAGADDYITKPFSVDELLARVRAVLRRSRTHEEIVATELIFGELFMDTKRRIVSVQGQDVCLTYLEFELLYCLLCHKDLAMSRERLLDLVWKASADGGPADRNVDMQIRSLRKKLGSCGELIKTVRGVGYKVSTAL
ncbi:MAG: response regulator transcription factor [Defluviitaleaceae bacterium]|nr:response regulator transcription factor [Defluviitaleaceae bacterium]